MRDIVIYGAGGFGRETALMIDQMNVVESNWKLIGFCDDNVSKGQLVHGLPVIGSASDLNEHGTPVSVAIAVADPQLRREIRSRIQNPLIDFPVLVHPSTLLGDLVRNSIGEGSIITAGNILTTDIRIKSFVIINLSCMIGHDAIIEDYCSIMPGCSISGSVAIGNSVLVGSGARILPGRKIGKNSRVGAGAVVTRDVADGLTVTGIPARPVFK